MRKTKIVCTLGPATNSEPMIQQLIHAGMNVVRLNFSHGTHQEHLSMITAIRKVSSQLGKPIPILQDLQGPKLRVGKIKTGSVVLNRGQQITIVADDIIGDEQRIGTSYRNLARDVRPGDKILLDDGLIELKAVESRGNEVLCQVIAGGILSDHKGINLPGVAISQPSFTDKDRDDLMFGMEHGVDLVAISFVRSADDVLAVKELIQSRGQEIMVLAKLEKPEAIDHLDKILAAADGVMIARGDLGVELPLQKVPLLQKRIIQQAAHLGKPVITATQMLESMRFNPRPTRAEVSDVANAIFDGTDAVMLSAETATGNYPVETVHTMARIITEAEQAGAWMGHRLSPAEKTLSIADAVSHSACEAAEFLNVKAIVAFTKSGFTARMVSKYRPKTQIIAFSPSEIVQRQLCLSWGICSLQMEYLDSTDQIIGRTEQILLDQKLVKHGDIIIILMGSPIFIKGTTNLMKLHVVGSAYK
ncbi:MAG: pyruvate kinase [candidate division KSB1 bacterium]|nr:pyruvate kinase [candidate division KSB1 bacterium]MDZ7334763.1 pyruvate kinase [candidate division KSB1 bacterium]MDZ7357185.1 pyruvate kinase [candidate division KSB1 bacterium]MDZ7398593.1 pyruvate kinase [candidate division KSB1 bacterium]